MGTVSVRYIVDDVDAAVAFYAEQLGFEVELRPAPGFALLARDDLRLLLSAPGAGGGGVGEPRPGGWNRFQLVVGDLDATVARLRDGGATVRTEVVTGKGGRQALVEDPAGNPIELLEPHAGAERHPGTALGVTAETLEAYLRDAYAQLVAVAERLGDALVDRRPHGARTNSVSALVAHCCGVTEYWLGHVALARPSARDRPAEFTATLDVAEIRALVAATADRAADDLRRLEKGEGGRSHPDLAHLPEGGGDAGIVLHVLEELYQHLGHAELTADALLAGPEGGA